MLHRIGAVLYFLWGALHLAAAAEGFRAALALDADAIQARLLQNSWNLAFFALASMAIAVALNWRNNAWGYWINLIMVSAADIGFVLFVLAPGHIAMVPGVFGPVLWMLAAIFSTLGLRARAPAAAA
ncbi:MAG: hypothetical protein AB7J28_06890 [Hyphomonadaceae bacterium]